MRAACLAGALILSGCAAYPAPYRFKPFHPPERPAMAEAPKPPSIARDILACGDKVCLTPEAMKALQKHIVDLEAAEKANRLRHEGYARNAEFLIEIMNNLLAGAR